MTKITRAIFQAHPFHLVSPSPWPLFTSMALLTLTITGVPCNMPVLNQAIYWNIQYPSPFTVSLPSSIITFDRWGSIKDARGGGMGGGGRGYWTISRKSGKFVFFRDPQRLHA